MVLILISTPPEAYFTGNLISWNSSINKELIAFEFYFRRIFFFMSYIHALGWYVRNKNREVEILTKWTPIYLFFFFFFFLSTSCVSRGRQGRAPCKWLYSSSLLLNFKVNIFIHMVSGKSSSVMTVIIINFILFKSPEALANNWFLETEI